MQATENVVKNKTVISTKDLNVYYGDFHALKSITMDIKENTVTAFIGPSGCGKSTFLRSLNRMNDSIQGFKVNGALSIQEESIYHAKTDVVYLRKKVGMVFQKAQVFPMSIYDNVAYGPRVHGIKDKKIIDQLVEESLKSAALWDEVKDRLHQSAMGMSGGQQQRLVIARVLAVQPDIILMDEPTSALDPIATEKIERLLFQLKDKYTIVLVTHSMQQAARVSDQTAFFLNGELIEFNDTQTLFTNATSQQTADYVSGRFG